MLLKVFVYRIRNHQSFQPGEIHNNSSIVSSRNALFFNLGQPRTNEIETE